MAGSWAIDPPMTPFPSTHLDDVTYNFRIYFVLEDVAAVHPLDTLTPAFVAVRVMDRVLAMNPVGEDASWLMPAFDFFIAETTGRYGRVLFGPKFNAQRSSKTNIVGPKGSNTSLEVDPAVAPLQSNATQILVGDDGVAIKWSNYVPGRSMSPNAYIYLIYKALKDHIWIWPSTRSAVVDFPPVTHDELVCLSNNGNAKLCVTLNAGSQLGTRVTYDILSRALIGLLAFPARFRSSRLSVQVYFVDSPGKKYNNPFLRIWITDASELTDHLDQDDAVGNVLTLNATAAGVDDGTNGTVEDVVPLADADQNYSNIAEVS